MELIFRERGILEINGVDIIFRNFAGRASKYNREGDRNFAIKIPTRELADELINDTSSAGVAWNVKIRESEDENDPPFIYMPVKIKFSSRGPAIYLNTNGKLTKLDEETIDLLDDADIINVDLDIRPYDNEVNGKPFRTAYLQSMCVTQNVDRFITKYASEEHPED